MENKLQDQWQFIKKNPFFEIMQSQDIWVRNQIRVNPCKQHQKPEGWVFENFLHLCLMTTSNILLKKELFNEFGYYDETLTCCEDYDLALKMARYKPIGLDQKEGFVRYQGHQDQLSKKYEAMDQFRVQSLAALLEKEKQESYRELIRSVLEKKLAILMNGAKKRNLIEKVNFYQEILSRI
ncbi:MAG: hypothetical protein WC860_02200 [Candidatus Margulisiibacteriota bacterium]